MKRPPGPLRVMNDINTKYFNDPHDLIVCDLVTRVHLIFLIQGCSQTSVVKVVN